MLKTAIGLIGIGTQAPAFLNNRLKLFSQLLMLVAVVKLTLKKLKTLLPRQVWKTWEAMLSITDHLAVKANVWKMFVINGKLAYTVFWYWHEF